MKLWQGLRNDLHAIIGARAGNRFSSHYKRHQQRGESRWRGMLFIAFGVLLVMFGALLGFAPGAPGIVFVIPGVALIAARLRFTARALDRAELAVRRRWRHRRETHHS